MLRSLFAIIAGYAPFGLGAVLLFALTGQDPHEPAPLGFKLGSIAAGIALALLAGYVVARLAPRRPTLHALVLAALIALAAGASIIARPDGGQIWSQLAALVLMSPAVVLGSLLGR